MLKLRQIDPDDYVVYEGGQRIGRIRYAKEQAPGFWIWNVHVHIPGSPSGTGDDLEQAKANLKKAWVDFKERVGPVRLAEGFKSLNIRDGS